MKFWVLSLSLVFAVTAFGVDPAEPITKEKIFNAMLAFRANPISPSGHAAGGLVMRFVDQSHDVVVNLNPKTLPFLSDQSIPPRLRNTLVAAFVIGNVDSQLLRNEKKNDSYAGLLQVIDTYKQIQQKNPRFRVFDIEQLIEMQKNGTLKEYAAE